MLALDSPPIIQLQVSNRTFNGITIGQLARYTCIEIAQRASGECTVKLFLEVTQHELTPEGEAGAQLPKDFAVRPIPLIADNTTAVDAQTGELRYQLVFDSGASAVDGPARPGEAYDYRTGLPVPIPAVAAGLSGWREFLKAHPDALALQGDFFVYVRDHVPQKIALLVTNHIQAANAMGKFA
ncbi:hypothetical protein [Hymenobacter koreensis]|uniref:Uncharacterized protein n=1 Tax=Hymenobacter koreensis TaxID=1084523 RepID=A0ABP8JJT2_9BACT